MRTVGRGCSIWSEEVCGGDESEEEDQTEDGEGEWGVCAHGAEE